MRPRHPYLLDRLDTVLIAVDLQEPFLRGIQSRDTLVSSCRLLIQAAALLSTPVVTTVQYAQRMGGVVSEISAVLPEDTTGPLDKLSFSCCGSAEFLAALKRLGREQILICGVETHICVLQTALDLKHLDYQVHCAVDAVSSRTFERHKIGMEKMRDAGVVPCTAEGAVMELTGEAGSPEFKSILGIMR